MATPLENGVTAAKAGNKQLAMQHLRQAVTEDPNNINAWLWISSLVDSPEQKVFCYQKVLKLDPNNKYALQGMNVINKTNTPSVQQQPIAPTYQQPSQPEKTQSKSIQRSHTKQPVIKSPVNKKVLLSKKPQKSIGVEGILKITVKVVLWLIVSPIILVLFFLLYMDTADFADFALRTVLAFWAISGYYGAWLLLKKGHGAGLLGCFILTGGAPILIPPFLGLFMLIWGRIAKDKHNQSEVYIVCPNCGQPTLANSAFCSHCGSSISHRKR